MRVQINSWEVVKSSKSSASVPDGRRHALYLLKCSEGRTWLVTRRWSEISKCIASVRKSEASIIQRSSTHLPAFEDHAPPWRLWGSNLDDEFLRGRAKMAESVLSALCTICEASVERRVGPAALLELLGADDVMFAEGLRSRRVSATPAPPTTPQRRGGDGGSSSTDTRHVAVMNASPGTLNMQTAVDVATRLEAAGDYAVAAEMLAAAMQALKTEQDETILVAAGAKQHELQRKAATRMRIEAAEANAKAKAAEEARAEEDDEDEGEEWEEGLNVEEALAGRFDADYPQEGSTLRQFFRDAGMKRLSRTSLGGETSSASASGAGAASSSAEDGVAREASFVVRDALGDERCSLTADGRVLGPGGSPLLAYIEADGTVGSSEMRFMGRVSAAVGVDKIGFVVDESDSTIAEVDYGSGVLRDGDGNLIAEVRRGGEVLAHNGSSAGHLDGYENHMLRYAAAYLLIVDPHFAVLEHSRGSFAHRLSSVLPLWQRNAVTKEALGSALAALDDEAVVRLVEHAMLGHVERKHRRSIVQIVADAETEPSPNDDGSPNSKKQQALALGLLYEQVARGGVRALMNIFVCALVGPSDDEWAAPELSSQRAVLRGVLFAAGLVTASHGSAGGDASGGASSSADPQLEGGSAHVVEEEGAFAVLCEPSLLETVLGLAFSEDEETRHDALKVLLQLCQTQPAARKVLASQPTLELLCRLAASHFTYDREMQLGLTLQLLNILLLNQEADVVMPPSKAELGKWLQPLLLKIHLKWGVEVVSKRGWKFEAREAAQRLLSWTAEV